LTAIKQRWYHNADFMVKGKNAFNSLLFSLWSSLTLIVGRITLAVYDGASLPADHVVFMFGLIFTYIFIVVQRSHCFKNGEGTQQDRIAILEAKVKELE